MDLLEQPAGRARIGLLIVLAGMALTEAAQAQTGPAGTPRGMDQAIALLAEARLHLQNVRDYECRLLKQERINGVLLPESVMLMRVRNYPLSVYLRSEYPEDDRGMEISYVEGRNEGMMRVHPAHWLGILGFWSVAVRDPRVFEKSRHAITEAGFGHLLESTARYWDRERHLDRTVVRIADDEIAGRPCTRIETIHPDRNAGRFYGYRCILWLDKATHMPAGAETYDWPRPDGPTAGELLESYRFLDLRCNVGLGEGAFPEH
jgi:hypothetical protein